MTDVYDPKKPDIIYLHPTEKSRPTHYVEQVESTGMIYDGKHSIAMYTSTAGVNQGPPGPPGEDQSSWYDTIIASASDEFTPITVGGPKTTFRAPYPLDLTTGYVRISLTQAPVGAAFIVSLTVNGAALFTTPVRIDDGMKTSVGSAVPAVIDPTKLIIPDDAEFLVYVDQIGTTFAGSGLKVAVTGIKTEIP